MPDRDHSTERLLSAREVAVILAVSRTTVYALVHRGVLPKPIQVGSRSRWRREDVEKITRGPRKLRKPKRPGETAA